MHTYSSNEEFFQALANLISRIKQGGQPDAAEALQAGLGAINGLTDGWAILMDSMEKVLAAFGKQLPSDQASELRAMLDVVKMVVFR